LSVISLLHVRLSRVIKILLIYLLIVDFADNRRKYFLLNRVSQRQT